MIYIPFSEWSHIIIDVTLFYKKISRTDMRKVYYTYDLLI